MRNQHPTSVDFDSPVWVKVKKRIYIKYIYSGWRTFMSYSCISLQVAFPLYVENVLNAQEWVGVILVLTLYAAHPGPLSWLEHVDP